MDKEEDKEKKKYKKLLDNYKNELFHKNSEKEFHKNQQYKIQKEINDIEMKINNLCKEFIEKNSTVILNNHQHYKDAHSLEISSTYYYDTDWFKTHYGIRNPQDSYGLPYEYEGPDTILYVVCPICEQHFTKEYKKEFGESKEEMNKKGEEIFKKGILKKERIELENTFKYS